MPTIRANRLLRWWPLGVAVGSMFSCWSAALAPADERQPIVLVAWVAAAFAALAAAGVSDISHRLEAERLMVVAVVAARAVQAVWLWPDRSWAARVGMVGSSVIIVWVLVVAHVVAGAAERSLLRTPR